MLAMASRGELEHRVMVLLWQATEPLTVAQVQALLAPDRELAYTTVMTVLDRLAKKAMVTRERADRAWRYEPADRQAVVLAREIADSLRDVPSQVRAEVFELLPSYLDLAPDDQHVLDVAEVTEPN